MTNKEMLEKLATQKPPRGTDWEKDGIGIDKIDGLVVIRMGDCTSCAVTMDYLRECVSRREEFAQRLADTEAKLRYTKPAEFLPGMIALLEAKAGVADMQAGNHGMAAAYSDAARMLRRAL